MKSLGNANVTNCPIGRYSMWRYVRLHTNSIPV